MKEADIRPADIFATYLRLSAEDAVRCFGDCPRIDIPCPACASTDAPHAFTKHGFAYRLCALCGTLFQSPRCSLDAYEQFYRDSVSTRFWAREFFPRVLEARRTNIFQPRVTTIAALCEAHGCAPVGISS